MIEMATVIVVIGVLTSITVSRVGPALEGARVRAAANVVAGDLQYAQSLAVRERRTIAVVVAAGQELRIQASDDPTVVFRRRALGASSDYRLSDVDITPGSLHFFPNGIARQTTEVAVALNGYERIVRVTRAGQIRITRPSDPVVVI